MLQLKWGGRGLVSWQLKPLGAHRGFLRDFHQMAETLFTYVKHLSCLEIERRSGRLKPFKPVPFPHIFPFPRFCPACAEAKKARFYSSSLLFIIWYITNPSIPIGLSWAWDMAGRKHWFGQILDSEFKTKQWLSVCKAQEMIKCASSPEKSINKNIMDLGPELVWRKQASLENLALLLQEDWDMS